MIITINNATDITAEAGSGCGASWVDLEIKSSNGAHDTVCLFFAEPSKAEQFAARFNYAAADEAVKAEVKRINALPYTIPVWPKPAGHTDAFGDQQDYDDERAHGWAFEGQS